MSDTNGLRTTVADELNRQPSDIIGSPSLSVGLVINREINASIRHYESTRFRWNETSESEFATTVDGTYTYSLPANLVRLDTLKLRYNNAFIFLQPRTWEYLEITHRQLTGSQGIPFEYAIYGNVLRVYPVPNQAVTLVGSYLHRIAPTSLTGSFCSITTMGGGSLTATSTASHNNRLDGWTTDGEDLIRSRTCASVAINYLHDPDAIAEMRGLVAVREPYLSVRERLAFERLTAEAQAHGALGLIQPYAI